MALRELALFAGAGGGILGGKLLGWNTIGAVEIEEYPRKVLLQRQQDGILGKFPIWDDITTFDGRPWKGAVDIVSGGFPCQDISAAGKGAGIDGERSGLWGEMARVVCEVSPRFVFVENSPMLTSRGLHRVLGDLAELGYDARWCVLGADDTGAQHRRKRIWILAYANTERLQKRRLSKEWRQNIPDTTWRSWSSEKMADTNKEGLQRRAEPEIQGQQIATGYTRQSRIEWWDTDPADVPNSKHYGLNRCPALESIRQTIQGSQKGEDGASEFKGTYPPRMSSTDQGIRSQETWPTQPQLGRVAHGVANRVDRLKAIGNGQVPAVAATAFTILSEGLM